ncbi:MAG: glycosyltransferase family 2 protein [Hyphomicrobiaceae bacterium]|nr:glycosyltransferase family 2 protein [Hyphomicrobiaceae bacterium]
MLHDKTVGVVIPARNEARAIRSVVEAIPPWVDHIIVADNGSTDRTAEIARSAGATVIHEPRAGYGSACLAGLAELAARGPVDIIVFLDGDNSDHPEDMADILAPILAEAADLVIGSRTLGAVEAGALTIPQRLGNWLATRLIALRFGVRFTDLGPFRAITREALAALAMSDRDYGWTVEMQVKAARLGLVCREVPVRYRRRIGTSKISGTLRGTVLAGSKILLVIARHGLAGPLPPAAAARRRQQAAGTEPTQRAEATD